MLLHSSSSGAQTQFSDSELDGRTVEKSLQSTKYSRVKFRKDRDGTIVAFEKCGCEAEANAFRSCRMHQGDLQQEARLRAEARYHIIQKWCLRSQHDLAKLVDVAH